MDKIITIACADSLSAFAAIDRIVAFAGRDNVVPGAAGDGVIASASSDVEAVVGAGAVDCIIARARDRTLNLSELGGVASRVRNCAAFTVAIVSDGHVFGQARAIEIVLIYAAFAADNRVVAEPVIQNERVLIIAAGQTVCASLASKCILTSLASDGVTARAAQKTVIARASQHIYANSVVRRVQRIVLSCEGQVFNLREDRRVEWVRESAHLIVGINHVDATRQCGPVDAVAISTALTAGDRVAVKAVGHQEHVLILVAKQNVVAFAAEECVFACAARNCLSACIGANIDRRVVQ